MVTVSHFGAAEAGAPGRFRNSPKNMLALKANGPDEWGRFVGLRESHVEKYQRQKYSDASIQVPLCRALRVFSFRGWLRELIKPRRGLWNQTKRLYSYGFRFDRRDCLLISFYERRVNRNFSFVRNFHSLFDRCNFCIHAQCKTFVTFSKILAISSLHGIHDWHWSRWPQKHL